MTDQSLQNSDGLLALPIIQEAAKHYKLTEKAFAFTFRSVAMPSPHSEAEFVSCIMVAQAHGLNPLTREIYFMRTKGGGIQAIVGVDGWVRTCNEHPKFDGMEFVDQHDDKGALISTTCIVYRSDRKNPVKVTEYLDECRANGGPVWKTAPRRMLRHRALTQAARYAFGFAGIMDHDEFDQWQRMRDVTPAAAPAARMAPPAVDEIPEIPDEKPDTRSPQASESTSEEPDTKPDITDVEGVLAKLREELLGEKDDAIRHEIWDAHSDLIERLPDGDQRRAQAIFEGRESRA